jgi:broad specificity phosphatase PhoE
MRQLAEAGRAAARGAGEAVRALGIPVGQVVSSEYCRTVETARLLGLGPVKTTRDLFNLAAASWLGGEEAVVERGRRVMRERPAPGTNTVLVAHGYLLQAAARVTLPAAGAAILLPMDQGEPKVIVVLTAEDWTELAAKFARPR